MHDTLREWLTFLMGIALIAAMLVLIYNSRGEEAQAWLVIGIVVQNFFSSSQSTRNFRQFQQSQPTVTTTTGPPQRTTVEPSAPPPQDAT